MSEWWEDVPVGAYGCTHSSAVFSKAIQYLCRSKVNHVVVNAGNGNVLEARAKGFTWGDINNYRTAVWNLSDFDPDNPHGLRMTVGDGYRVVQKARTLIGRGYGFLTIGYLALALLGVQWEWLLKKVANQNRLICSQAADYAYYLADLHLFTDGRAFAVVKPDDLEERLLLGDIA